MPTSVLGSHLLAQREFWVLMETTDPNMSEEFAAQEKNCSAFSALRGESPQESMMRISVFAGLFQC